MYQTSRRWPLHLAASLLLFFSSVLLNASSVKALDMYEEEPDSQGGHWPTYGYEGYGEYGMNDGQIMPDSKKWQFNGLNLKIEVYELYENELGEPAVSVASYKNDFFGYSTGGIFNVNGYNKIALDGFAANAFPSLARRFHRTNDAWRKKRDEEGNILEIFENVESSTGTNWPATAGGVPVQIFGGAAFSFFELELADGNFLPKRVGNWRWFDGSPIVPQVIRVRAPLLIRKPAAENLPTVRFFFIRKGAKTAQEWEALGFDLSEYLPSGFSASFGGMAVEFESEGLDNAFHGSFVPDGSGSGSGPGSGDDDFDAGGAAGSLFEEFQEHLQKALGPIGSLLTFPLTILESLRGNHAGACSVDFGAVSFYGISMPFNFSFCEWAPIIEHIHLYTAIAGIYLVFNGARDLIDKLTGVEL